VGLLVTLPLTALADRVLQLTEQEVEHFGHEYIGTEHLLLGSVREGRSVATAILRALSVDPGEIRRQVERIVVYGPPGERVVFGSLPYTPHADEALALAADEARSLGDEGVGPEHLLLGLIRVEDGVAAQVLLRLGADHGAVLEEVRRRRPTPKGWRTEAVVALARGISADGAYDRLPVLADALEDAECADPEVFKHLRLGTAHGCRAPGCWVIDRLLSVDRRDTSSDLEVGSSAGSTQTRSRPWWRFWG
jgi:hypothetical protein